MTIAADRASLEEQIAHWRQYLRRRRAIDGPDVEELEDHLRKQVEVLIETGLVADEAFLVAVKRMGNLDALSREFAREHSQRLWKQLVMAPDAGTEPGEAARNETLVVFGLAIAAALSVKLPALFGLQLGGGDEAFYARNASLFVLPLLTGYFAWKRGLDVVRWVWLSRPRPFSQTSTHSRRAAIPRCWPRCTCRLHCGSSSVSPMSAGGGSPAAGAWTSCDSPASSPSITCSSHSAGACSPPSPS
jgi:hypothetical protein